MAIQMRQGNEVDFDAEKMLPGEWAVSTDARIVRMCFAPGVVVRMATYEAFEADMVAIEAILKNVQDIHTAVKLVQDQIDGKSELVAENASLAEQYMIKAKEYSELAGALAGTQIAQRDVIGVVKGGDMAVDDDGALRNFRRAKGTNVTVMGTVEAPLSIKMYGKSVQETVPGNNLYDSSFRLNYGPILCIHGNATESNGVYTLDVTAKDCYINMHSDVGSSYSQEHGYLVEIPEGVTLLHVSLSNSSFIKNFVNIFDGDKISLACTLYTTSSFVVDLSTRPTAKYIALRFGLPDTISSGTYETTVMINSGSTALPWEPYVGGIPSPNPDYPQEIKSVVVNEVKVCWKNLLKNTATTQTNKGVTFTVNEDGTVVANGTATSNASLQLYEGIFPDNTILTGGIDVNARIQIVNKTDDKYTLLVRDEGNGKNLDLSKFNYGYAEISILSGTVCNNLLFKPMIRLASITDDTYEPYTENTATLSQPITLHGIGDVMDELTADGVVRRVGVDTLPKTGWREIGEIDNFVEIFVKLPKVCKVTQNAMSNYFAQKLNNRIELNPISETVYVRFPIETVSSYEEAYEWFANHDVVIYYNLAEPITEPLPEADQIALRSLHSYDGVTHVMCDAEIVPTMEAECATSNVAALAMYIKIDYVPRAKYNELESRLSALEKQIVNY